MNEVVSLIDEETIIVQTTKAITDSQRSKYEKELEEKLNRKVVVVPFGMKLYSMYSLDTVKESNKEIMSKFKIGDSKIINQVIGKSVSETKQDKTIWEAKIQEDNPTFKVLTKEQFIQLKQDLNRKEYEEQWDQLAKGNKYIVQYNHSFYKLPIFMSLDSFIERNSVSKLQEKH